jgi:glycosyltransferase involved in cell wall biosynthesis
LGGDARDPHHLNLPIIQSIASLHPDVIVFQGYGDPTNLLAILFSKIAGIPYVLSVDGGDISSAPKITQHFVRSIVRGADAFIAGGRSAEKLLISCGAPRERIFRILVATDLNRFQSLADHIGADSIPATPDEETGAKTILFIGRLVPEKGVLDLTEAFLRLYIEDRRLKLVIIGRGPLKEEIRKTTQGLSPGTVEIIDYLEEDEFVRTLTKSHVLVLPSRKEPLGIVTLEAYVSGTPVVLSDACGSVGVLPDSPWVTAFPAGDVDLLTSSIREALGLRRRSVDPDHQNQIEAFLNENSLDRRAKEFESVIKTAAKLH